MASPALVINTQRATARASPGARPSPRGPRSPRVSQSPRSPRFVSPRASAVTRSGVLIDKGTKKHTDMSADLTQSTLTGLLAETYGHQVKEWDIGAPERDPPSLQKARHHWYNFVLPRRKKHLEGDDEGTSAVRIRKCEQGEEGGKLYPIWSTPYGELGDFGLGVGMYFNSLAIVGAAMFVVGFVHIGSMRYFDSDAYRGEGRGHDASLPFFLRWSAACEEETVCLDALCETTREASVCPFAAVVAWSDLAALGLLGVGMVLVSRSQAKAVRVLDEDEQTAQDYSVVVHDPSPDATDADAYEEFFRSRFGPVRFVTVSKKNGDLLRALAYRRHCREQLNFKRSRDDTVMDEESCINRALRWLGLRRGVFYWADELQRISARIREHLRDPSMTQAARVFVSFETEEAQRKCLQAMTDGLLNVLLDRNVTSWLTRHRVRDEHLWRNKDGSSNRLHVEEAPEATDVIWQHQDLSIFARAQDRLIGFLLCAVTISAVAWGIIALSDAGQSAAVGLFISAANSALPGLMKAITATERHLTEGSKQSSMLLKLVVARWMTTAIIQKIITPVGDAVAVDTVAQIRDILIADAVTTPLIRLLDLSGRFRRLALARFAKTQAHMDSHFEGSEWSLAERYTDLTKTVFVSVLNMAVFPVGLWISFLALIANFWVDKYCLLRVWAPKPTLGAEITRVNRTYISLSLLVHLVAALHTFAQWPFDGYAATDRDVAAGSADTTRREAVYERVAILDSRAPENWFLTPTADYMSDEQESAIDAFNVLTLGCLVAFVVIYFGDEAALSVKRLLRGDYKAVGASQGVAHSDLVGDRAIDAYTPVIKVPGQKYPLIAAELDFAIEHLPFTVEQRELDYLSIWAEVCDPHRPGASVEHDAHFADVKQYSRRNRV